jgi:hypothetical protein
MFERYTDRARKVMALANQAAHLLNHESIGSEHILLGLLREGSGVGANVLKNMDLSLPAVRAEVERLVKGGSDAIPEGKLPQNVQAKKVLELATNEALNLNHNYVGTEHLLLGLLGQHDGVAAQTLRNFGLKLEDVREEVLNLLGAGVEIDDEDELEALKSRFAAHPVILELQAHIESLSIEKEKAIKAVNYEDAARLRDQENALRTKLDSFLRALAKDPTLGQPELRGLTNFGAEMRCLAYRCMRPKELDSAVQAVMADKPVLIVGGRGTGRRSLAGFCAKRVVDESGRKRLVPRRLVEADHAALAKADGGTESALLSALELLRTGVDFVPTIAEAHLLADPVIVIQSDLWAYFIKQCLELGRPLVCWTTPEGEQSLRQTWPGFVNSSHVVRLDEMPKKNVLEVVHERMNLISKERNAVFDGTFLNRFSEVIDSRHASSLLGQPGRAIEMLERIVEFATTSGNQPQALSHPGAMPDKVDTLKTTLFRQIQANMFGEALSLIKKLMQGSSVPIPEDRLVKISGEMICGFLECNKSDDQNS